jgi:hypothetical protein
MKRLLPSGCWHAGLLFAVFFGVAAEVIASILPPILVDENPRFNLHGEGTFRFWGIKVYEIRLWTSTNSFSADEPFAMELVYDLSLKGRDIAERSIKEMRAQGWRDESKLQRWGDAMRGVFPDVAKGESLIGVSIPGKEVRFYSRSRQLGVVRDPEFAKAFFDIWLSEKTSDPGLRKRLIGEN